MKKSLFLLMLILLLTACAPETPETQAVKNADPASLAGAQATTLDSLSNFMDQDIQRVALLMRAQQPDYSGLMFALIIGGLFAFAGCCVLSYFLLLNFSRKVPMPATVQKSPENYGMVRYVPIPVQVFIWRVGETIHIRDNNGERTLTAQEYALFQGVQNEQISRYDH